RRPKPGSWTRRCATRADRRCSPPVRATCAPAAARPAAAPDLVPREAALTAFHHVQVAMPAGAEEDAERFYSGLLGLERVPKPEALAGRGGAWFRGAGVEVHLGVELEFRPARKAHPAFIVRGLAELTSRLEGGGVAI